MAKLILVHDGVNLRDYSLEKGEVTLGRKPGNDIQLDDAAVSSHHARLVREESAYLDGHYDYYIEDLNSTNGTLVNGVGMEKHLLKHGDKIQVGKHTFIFDSGQGSHEETAIYLPDT
ncbi:MAG: FHA domain-containing protein [Gammaproteobacteria bacterium]|jgi:pSer/pThr/pTyr-binding forkhead associated (FHA) protein